MSWVSATNEAGSAAQTTAALNVELSLDLSAKSKQKPKKLKLKVSCGSLPCTAQITGKAKLPAKGGGSAAKTKSFKVKPKTVSLVAGETKKVRVKFKNNKKSVKQITKLLKKGGKKTRKRAKVNAKVTATDSGGTTASGKQKIKLKR